MFWSTFTYELRYRFRLVSTWVYIILMFGIAFLMAVTTGGAFDDVKMNTGKVGEHIFVNNPSSIASIILALIYIATIIFAAIYGSSSVRDFENGSYPLFFSKPIKPKAYVMGRFLGAYCTALAVALTGVLGMALGYQMPFLAEHSIGPHYPMAYIHTIFYFIVPNLFYLGILFFGIGLLTRKVINSYIAGITLFLFYSMARTMLRDVESLKYASYLDPFGGMALRAYTRHWTTAQTNITFLSLNSSLGINRLIWIGIGCLILGYTLYRFKFVWKETAVKPQKIKVEKVSPAKQLNLESTVTLHHYASGRQFISLCWYEFKNIVFTRTFLVIMSLFSFILFMTSTQLVGKLYGTQTHPLTSQVIDVLSINLLMFGLIISTFYAGELMWRERILKMDQLIDVTPHHSRVKFFSKFCAVLLMQLSFLVVIMLVGMITQVAKGYYNLEPGLYLFSLGVVQLTTLLPFTIILFFFAIVLNNRYAGYLGMILFYCMSIMLEIFKVDHPLLSFGSGYANYSEMNGWGNSLIRFFLLKSYWILFSIVLCIIGFKFWNRGVDSSYRSKISAIKRRGFDNGWRLASVALAMFIGLGSFLFYNMNILNDYTSPRKQKQLQVQYEKQFKQRLSGLPQPRIVDVQLKVDLYPSRRTMTTSGSYWVVNRTAGPIDTLVINYDETFPKYELSFDRKVELKESYRDEELHIYRLEEPLVAQDSMRVEFAIEYQRKGIRSGTNESLIVKNGTFFHSDIFPNFGYNSRIELNDNNDRKKEGLPPNLRMPPITDLKQRENPYISTDSDYVRYAVEISTEDDQIAFAPGDLLESWTKDGRYHASYGSSVPILNFLAFVSGRYEKATADFQGKEIAIYYDKKHPYNIKAMLESAHNSLQYFSENFMPYPHQALTIVEVPYVGFAQSFPALIPFSENIGFIAKVDPEDKTSVDYPYQITAHEIAHQWWAHTVIGANVQGSTMFSECFAEYSSMMILKHKYGAERLRRYLNYTNDSYLNGRSSEFREEQPLYLNENQGYLNYNKGTLVMYALQDYIGEAALNQQLGAFCRDYAYHSNPYPVSTDVMPYIRRAIPEDKQYLATDLFETITLFDNKVIQADSKYDSQTKLYATTIMFQTEKARYDGQGNKSPVEIQDQLDIAIYDGKGEKPLTQSTIKVSGGIQSLRLITTEKPGKVILDPFFKLIDVKPDDNIKDVS